MAPGHVSPGMDSGIRNTKRVWMGSVRWGLIFVVWMVLGFPLPSQATLGEGLSSLSRDADLLGAGLSKPSPCITPKDNLTDSPEFYERLCMYYRITSIIGGVHAREYVLLNPPQKIFAVYWEGRVRVRELLGPAYEKLFRKAQKRTGRRLEIGPLVIFRRGDRYFVVDKALVPKGMRVDELDPTGASRVRPGRARPTAPAR
jgi:hypothetical protein